MRWKNFARDVKMRLLRKSNLCGLCNQQIMNMKDATIDHIVPVSKGGMHAISNMQLACFECNQKKGDSLPDEL